MAISSVRLLAIFFFFLVIFVSLSTSEIRYTKIRSNDHLIIPLDDFGFGLTGNIDLNVSDISFPNYETSDVSLLGFFLIPKDSLIHLADDIQQNKICPLRSKLVDVISDFRNIPHGSHSLSISHRTQHPNKYTLIFANCIPSQPISMDVSSAMYNFDLRTANRNYLSAGESTLPWFFFFFALVYAGLTVLWIQTLRKNRSTVFKIHFFMLFVVVLKALNLLCEAEEKSFISRTGTAHGWDILFYIFSFLKGISLFSLIVLIGTGWSFLKIYLQDREKKVLMIVIPLQVIANIAQIVIDESGPYEVDWITWKQVFMLVDVVCCCAVLFPIVWSIKNLREAAKTDGKAAVNLMKLTIFRHYYIIVICYIYFTRVVVYALVTITSYKYAWTSVVAGELATLAFYVFTGYKFKPEPRNPYFAIDDEEEEAAAEALKLEDEFEL